ncbi:glycogen/starch/alpha-glucan family phosphorylase [Chitinispirillales bacterium ANBcel5]|uniref:glycogen/starch/alpha-glucan family phosphorylase n=1 Tax=Cellulosispirillum alkaliphilum TaxID=3039283 RepID=UPI002A52AF85|nr:glycogen/starch/alpha-glucan family phosphorylase [Chitinispirillales bacterium ANBcel5]
MNNKNLRETFYRYLRYFLAKDESTATTYDKYMALAYAVRSELVDRWIETQKRYKERTLKRVYYLSMEYTLGKSLYSNILSLGIMEAMTSAVESLGFSIDELYQKEDDFELGNDGKSRVAACFLEAAATLDIPVMAYGLRYDYGQFQQQIKNGTQVEKPYDWLHRGHPWEIVRPEYSCSIQFAGDCKRANDSTPLGPYNWKGEEVVHAVPYDVPIAGYCNKTVNTLRMWSARASEEFLSDYLNHGDYVRACDEKSQSGRITKVMFPEEGVRRAHELRLKQQYFFVSAALQDIVRRYKSQGGEISDLDKQIVIQVNGSKCALAIPEMMRILVDSERLPWGKAWSITQNIFAYTSNAVSKDNIETWPVYKIGQMLPRIMQIIFDINQLHLEEVGKRTGNNSSTLRELSLIEEGEVKRIRFADLAILGSFSINGVSKSHTDLIKKQIFPHFSRYFPERFNSKTNGVAHRRWLLVDNKDLAELISDTIGNRWIKEPEQLINLERHADNTDVLKKLALVKAKTKENLCTILNETIGVSVNKDMFFDIQSRNIHTGKRQVLHLLHILHRYILIKNGDKTLLPRVHIFSGKASPSDFLAKQIIHLINVIADLVNKDPQLSGKMKIVFIPNFGMSWAERIVPAADLSEQISTATLEASGTFNMKFALNGAITIASRSGSNLEMIEKVGTDNIFPFGRKTEELLAMNDYNPNDIIGADRRLEDIFSLLDELLPAVQDGHAIYPLLSSLRDADRQFALLDFDDYVSKQKDIDILFANKNDWYRKCLLNIARVGWFSADRAVKEYAQTIWKIPV